MTWGVGGTGGTGTWNATTANWWDGSQNVVWQQSGNAIFSGSAATVTASTFAVTASGMIFNVPGYTLSSGAIFSGSNGLTITTNADATISTTLESNGNSGNLLIKSGTATLSMAGTNFFGTVQVNQGEYRLTGNGSLFFSSVNLALSSLLTLAQTSSSQSIAGLNGSGIVQSDTSARTVTLTLFGGGSFSGALQDNGGGKLALTMFSSATTSLTGVNTYSGATSVSVGKLAFSGSGSALNTAFSISSSGMLLLDNLTGANTNRISDSAPITMQSGTLSMVGNNATFVNETTGALNFAGAATVNVERSGTSAALSVSGVTRTGHGTLSFSGDGQLLGTGLTNDSTGIAPIYVHARNDWAVLDDSSSLAPFSNYVSDPNAATSSSHVKLASPFTISGTATWASLNLQNDNTGVTNVVSNGKLNLVSGGILSSGSASAFISQTNLTTSGTEMLIVNNNALGIDGQIQEFTPGMALTKSGTGVLTLSATANSYSGTTSIEQGTVVIGNGAALGTGKAIEFGGGTLKAAGNFSLAQNLTRSTSFVAVIDTGGFNVTVSGSNSALQKSGSGTLILTNSAVGSVTLASGTMQLTRPTSGNATINGGTLIGSGTLSSLAFSGTTGILDIGGAPAFTLDAPISSSSLLSLSRLTINFGIGSSGRDLWKLTSAPFFFNAAAGTFRFEFQNLGGATTGTNYTLMTFPSTFPSPSSSIFAFAPDMAAAGWTGTFLTSGTDVRVSFTSVGAVPEPGSVILLTIGLLACGASGIRKR
ncbi:MAG: autotransporter family porin [Chthoniobacter sp.]|nr:autotransporter family porin [Chthoniobacter sp.]